ncbi:MAG: beta strand repeat-containing protein, partial [Bacteroidales bacterium]
MKIFFTLAISLMLSIGMAQGQTTKTVGASGANYSTLKAAFDAINTGAIKGAIILQITGSTSETNTAALNASGTLGSSYTSVTIFPTVTGKTISGNMAIPLIQLNGAANVTIDGRVDQTGVKNLVITNTNTGTGSSTIRFVNSAANNTVKYCTIKGSGTNSGGGVLLFSSSASGNGNNNNIIDNNNITSDAAGRPCNAIFSSGSSGRENSGNIISNNTIYDFLSQDYSARGVNIASNSIDWTISGNSFYETTTIVPAASNNYNVISISTSVSHLISGNYIGGSAPFCGGSPLTINSSFAHYFYGIYISGGAGTPVTVQNNIIQNINYTSTCSNPWDGIYLASGNINVTGNTIGATTGTGSIIISTPNASATTTISGGVVTAINLVGGGSGFTTAPIVTFSVSGSTTSATATSTISGGVVTGFTITNGGAGYTSAPSVNINASNYSTSHGIRHLSTGTVTISNNNIGSITTVGNNTYSHCFESIVISGAAPSITITNNLIGSLTTANSIQTSSAAASSLLKQDTRGVLMNAAVPLTTISGNTFANLTSYYTGNSVSKLDGICTYSGSSNTIQNNIIRNLTTGSSSIIVKGIEEMVQTSGTNQTITGNTIFNLSNTNTTALVAVRGIDYIGPISGTNTVCGNFIHSLSIASTNTSSEISGISLGNGVTTIANNIISLGAGITTGYKIYGIIDNSNASVANTNNIYFNSVHVGGVVSSGTTSSTGALWNANNVCIRNYRNNILMNVRSGGATGKHYAIRVAATSGLTINYNNYWVTGSAVLGYLGADKTTLAAWQSATGQDANSLNINPGFTNAGGTSAFDYYSSATLPGISGTGITTDYDGLTRGISPKMGALEVNSYVWQGNTNNDFGTAANWTYGAVPPNGADISFAPNPGNNCVLDQNRSLEDITNAQGTYNFITNGKQLTITGHLYFSNDAKINATTASSVVLFAGSAAQSIPAGAFVSNIIDGLSVNNNFGLTLNSNLTVSQELTLTNGAFIIGANTLTLNGGITTTAGILTGGSSTNITFGGSGAGTILPAVSLNNLTLNRTNGIALGGSISITGTLALTAGSLTIGANTLTISGSSPTRASGSIDASNASANLIFANVSAITLPGSIFSAVVNNLTISGAGGVTSGSDFSLNGILNLQSVNPSVTKGILDMWDGSVMRTLTMGGNATTVGTGDVTGIITRNSFTVNTPYSFGNQYTTLNMAAGGILPTALSVKIILTSSDISWKPNAIHRYYDIVQTGGNAATKVTLNLHYQDNELNSTTEGNLDLFDYHVSG